MSNSDTYSINMKNINQESAVTEFVRFLKKNEEEGTDLQLHKKKSIAGGFILEFSFNYKKPEKS